MFIACKRANVVHRGDAARRRDLVLRRRAQTPEPVEIGALHHAFFVDIGAQEAAAIRLQPLDHFFGREIGRLLPALDDDLAVLRIERDQDRAPAPPPPRFLRAPA